MGEAHPSAIFPLLSPTNADIMRVFFAVCQARATRIWVSGLSDPQRPDRRSVIRLAKNGCASDQDIGTGLTDGTSIGGIDAAIHFNGHLETPRGDLVLQGADLV